MARVDRRYRGARFTLAAMAAAAAGCLDYGALSNPSDLAAPDGKPLYGADLSTRDGADLAMPRAADLAMGADLRVAGDLARPPDLAVPVDFASLPDLVRIGPSCGMTLTPTCATSGLVFCDDFESCSIDSTRWFPPQSSVMGQLYITADPTASCRGSCFLEATSLGGTSYSSIATMSFATSLATAYARVYVFQKTNLSNTTVVTLYDTNGSSVSLAVESGQWVLYNNTTQLGVSAGLAPTQQWVCMELGATSGSVKLWQDDLLILGPTAVSATPFTQLRLGATVSRGTQSRADVLFDEVVVNDTYVPCAR